MTAERIFVGRKAELEQFKKVLEDPRGQAVLVVGQAGMGKTWLINKMADLAGNHPQLKCGYVRYEVTPTDSVDSTMALVMDNAFEAAQVEEGSFVGTKRRLEQWRSLLNVINLGDLVMSLRRDPQRNTRDQFLERLRLISEKMPENGRAIFIIDPEKYMQKESDQAWAIVVKQLPEKIKFVFAQRPDDVLVGSDTFGALNNNVERIPQERLDILDQQAIAELLNLRAGRTDYTVTELRQALARYEGHPYAIGAALDLLEAGTKLEELPPDPTGIAAAQWKELTKRGKDAIRLFKAYAILEVGVPDDVVNAVNGLDADTRQSLLADNYLSGLLRQEGYGRRIYHAILADYILKQLSKAETKKYHSRGANFYRGKLKEAREKQTAPDALAATRLGEHVLATEVSTMFVYSFVEECTKPLLDLGFLDAAMDLSDHALKVVQKGSEEHAVILGNVGLIYQMRGDLEQAKEMYRQVLEIEQKLGRSETIASTYGNLGLIYQKRGDLDKAEEMFVKTKEIHKQLRSQDALPKDYGNLGLIYQTKGKLDKAEEIYRKVLEMDGGLGRLESIANAFSNLAGIYMMRGELDKAQEMQKSSLEINVKLGRRKGIARDWGNLGVIYRTRGELDKAEEIHHRSLEINEKLGCLEAMANQYDNLGLIHRTRGDLDKAEEMHRKSREIKEKLGDRAGAAVSYGYLGLVYMRKGDLDKAEESHKRSLEIAEKLGLQEVMASGYTNLGLVYKQRGHVDRARRCSEKAQELFKRMGMKPEVEKVQGWIEGLEDTRKSEDSSEKSEGESVQ